LQNESNGVLSDEKTKPAKILKEKVMTSRPGQLEVFWVSEQLPTYERIYPPHWRQ